MNISFGRLALFAGLLGNAAGHSFLFVVLPPLGRRMGFADLQTGALLSQEISRIGSDCSHVLIDVAGNYSLNGKALLKSDLNSLMAALSKESGGDNRLPMVISADGKTPHQAVITAMDAAGKLGFSHLRMSTVEAASQP